MDWGDSWPFGLCGLFPAIDWQARALAAEADLARANHELMMYAGAEAALDCDAAKTVVKLLKYGDADCPKPVLEAAVRAFLAHWDDLGRDEAVSDKRVEALREALAATPTSPPAVAALVRAARALYEKAKGWPHSEGAHAWCPPSSPPCARCDTLSTLEPLLDAPPWRHIR